MYTSTVCKRTEPQEKDHENFLHPTCSGKSETHHLIQSVFIPSSLFCIYIYIHLVSGRGGGARGRQGASYIQ